MKVMFLLLPGCAVEGRLERDGLLASQLARSSSRPASPSPGHHLPLASSPQTGLSHMAHTLPGRSSLTITRGWAGRPRDPSQHQHTPGPFSPRFQVGRWEVGDVEWLQEIRRGLQASGLVPGVLPEYPTGLVNINFGVHACVHMGTHLAAQTVSSPPSRLSYPAERGGLYTLILLDAETNLLQWMVTNIPGTSLPDGQVIAEYQPPAPSAGGAHRFLAVALRQEGVVNRRSLAKYSAYLCQLQGRRDFNIRSFLAEHKMNVAAANYFVVSHDTFVNTINDYCRKRIGI